MTKFVNVSGEAIPRITVFTHVMRDGQEWSKSVGHFVEDYDKVVYLGICTTDGQMFAAYQKGIIEIFRGIKRDEFDNQ